MKRIHATKRSTVMIIAAAIAAITIAACGGNSSTSAKTTTKSAGAKTAFASRTELAACLKKHGVTLPTGGSHRPAPTGTGAGPTGTAPTGSGSAGGFTGGSHPGTGRGFLGATSSKDEKAFEACGASFGAGPAGRDFTSGATPKVSTKVLATYVACIRKNGYTAMPNAYSTSKTTAFPASVETNAEFKKANAKCVSIVEKAFKQPSGARTSLGTSTAATA